MSVRPEDLLHPRPEGLYCPPGNFFIDPLQPVGRALVTHAHSDHARPGHGAVLATRETLDIMAIRLGADFCGTRQIAPYGETIVEGGVAIRFEPAGHVLGSAQILLEWRGCRIVVSGDYKRQADPTTPAFAPISCDVFVTEATFGLPVFRHPDPAAEIAKLLASLRRFPERAHLVGAYSLGKAQRVIRLIRDAGYDAPIHLHGALEKVTRYYTERGIPLGDLRPATGAARADLAGALVLCPPASLADLWSRRFPDPVTAVASGWMRIKARARQNGAELPLVISDHADWPDLTATLPQTGAGQIWVTHGQEDALVHWCQAGGWAARPLRLVGYGDEDAGGAA
ncbi:ligase-associated DNA damage response exonuclease [Rhabdaerophilum calidifontis]|uniref:ligase-associated DNA damage response exonuclease n=1 Tax=Rhabdaerophilum calidifontis TaxID=2604328 RepID=UPI00123A7D8C|nr:ligase-associated DNA damage response exonuclease [Rhabdaerophilum calidifontis]